MKYDFDEVIDRSESNSMSLEGFRDYLFYSNADELDLPCKEHELISMWIADMAFATPPPIIEALHNRLNKRILGYSQVFDPQYKQSFIDWVQTRHGWKIDKRQIYTSLGVIPALFDLIKYICELDEKILILTPSYALFKLAANVSNIELVTSNLMIVNGQYMMDYDDIEQKAKDEKLSLCIFCNPHNPTGRVWTQDELKQVGDICLRNNVMIVSDEVHCDLVRKDVVFTPLAKLYPDSDQIVTCMAPSKTFNLAGMLLANLVIPNEKLQSVWKLKLPIENPLSITAVQAAYTSGHEWLRQLSEYLDSNFLYLDEYLKTHLPRAEFNISEATYLAWVYVGAYLPDVENLTLFFANHAGVLLEGGNMFVSNADGYIRLNLACPKSVLQTGLDRIVIAINDHQK